MRCNKLKESESRTGTETGSGIAWSDAAGMREVQGVRSEYNQQCWNVQG
jgi:hypothetical protein